MSNKVKIGIIGFGSMGSAVAQRLKEADKHDVIISRKQKGVSNGIETAKDNISLAKSCDVIILAVKQKDLATVASEIAPYVEGKLVISLMASITLDYLDTLLKSRNARVMTNIAFVFGSAISGYCMGKKCNSKDAEIVKEILKYGGTQVLQIEENQMNKITVASSCSIGFLAETFDYYQKALVKLGFDNDTAKDMINNSIKGTVALSTSTSFGEISEKVASKGGLTAAGLAVLKNWKTDQIIDNAVEAAEKRADEISETHTSEVKREHSKSRVGISEVNVVVVKVGTTNIVDDKFKVDMDKLANLVEGITNVRKKGVKVIIVTSGAVGSGRGRFGAEKTFEKKAQKKAAASVGQVVLMHAYEELFRKHGQTVGQILLTEDDFKDKERFGSFVETVNTLLNDLDVIPIINENDVTTNEGTTFNENDTLSARIAAGVSANLVVILSDVDGLYTSDPRTNPPAVLIGHIDEIDKAVSIAGGAQKGVGGMRSKIRAVNMLISSKIPVVIANGNKKRVLERIIEGEEVGTLFK